jgi:hypothetical protein
VFYFTKQYDRNIDETLNERLKEAKEKMQADFDERVKMVEEEKDLLARFVISVTFKSGILTFVISVCLKYSFFPNPDVLQIRRTN